MFTWQELRQSTDRDKNNEDSYNALISSEKEMLKYYVNIRFKDVKQIVLSNYENTAIIKAMIS